MDFFLNLRNYNQISDSEYSHVTNILKNIFFSKKGFSKQTQWIKKSNATSYNDSTPLWK